MSVYMEGGLARVSANHVIAVRILASSDGFLVQALTTDWAIDLERHDSHEDALTHLEKLTNDLRHQ
jgi:hypothetical protein